MCSETTKSHTTRESAANVLRDHEEPHNSGEKLFWGHHHFKQKGYIPNGSFGWGHGGMVVVAIDSGASPHLGHMLRLE